MVIVYIVILGNFSRSYDRQCALKYVLLFLLFLRILLRYLLNIWVCTHNINLEMNNHFRRKCRFCSIMAALA